MNIIKTTAITLVTVLSIAAMSGASALTYTFVNNTSSFSTTLFPLACSNSKVITPFETCEGQTNPGVTNPGSTAKCTVNSIFFKIGCKNKFPCPLTIYSNDACTGSAIASTFADEQGNFQKMINKNKLFNVTANGHTITIDSK